MWEKEEEEEEDDEEETKVEVDTEEKLNDWGCGTTPPGRERCIFEELR